MAVASRADRPRSKRKVDSIHRIKDLAETYHSLIVFNCDNVGSNQLKKIRVLTRQDGVLIMGKNSLFKKGLHSKSDAVFTMERVISQIRGNVGLFFTNKSLKDMRDALESVSEQAPVRNGMIAQCDVVVPKGLTSMPPDKTSFFQALNIATMINKSAIEILSDIHLLKKGQKVNASEATLLQMLNIRPFAYMLHCKYIYDNGMCYPPEVLDIKRADIIENFHKVAADIAAISLDINYPTKVSVPYAIQSGLREVLSVCVELDISNEYVDKIKAASASAATAAAQKSVSQPAAVKQEAAVKAPPPKEESDEECEFNLFD